MRCAMRAASPAVGLRLIYWYLYCFQRTMQKVCDAVRSAVYHRRRNRQMPGRETIGRSSASTLPGQSGRRLSFMLSSQYSRPIMPDAKRRLTRHDLICGNYVGSTNTMIPTDHDASLADYPSMGTTLPTGSGRWFGNGY